MSLPTGGDAQYGVYRVLTEDKYIRIQYGNNYYVQKALNNVNMIGELADSNYREGDLRFGSGSVGVVVRG